MSDTAEEIGAVRNINDIHKKAKEHFNEPVLDGLKVVRLIGYGEDDQDCYWIVNAPEGIYWLSAVVDVMSLRFLKNQGQCFSSDGELWNDYVRIDYWLSLSGAPLAKSFVLKATY
jgi:hypothetical protein